ncbi:MAG: ADP-ribosylglycohydrolase family protein [Anaerolineales bacterium]|nr:ADP-ribosylglycohydrolase family protein [Anaerolineales bacterium]
MSTPTLLSRIHGCIAALAIGDAYGIIGQWSMAANKAMWGQPPADFTAPKPAPEDPTVHADMKRGEITDDTMAMLALVNSIIQHGDLTIETAAAAIVKWIEDCDGFNLPWVGPSTTRAVRALMAGEDPRRTGLQGTTNGSSMRVAPIGFLGAPDLEKAAAYAVTSAYPTHATATATSGAAAIACATAAAATPGASLDDIVRAAMLGADRGEAAGVVYSQAPSISRRIAHAIDLISNDHSEEQKLQDIYDFIGTSMMTHETVPAVLALVVMGEADPMKVIRLSTWIGGDCDTLAAIAGAIAGAYRGVEAIPAAMLQTVDEVNGLDLAATAAAYHEVVLKLNPAAVAL